MSKVLTFHVGLGKTGSSYLQQAFFPKLKGVTYIPTRRFHKFEAELDQSNEGRYLLSREFDQQLESEAIRIASYDKEAKIIIVLRPQAAWIGSQYKRFAKNGMHETFDEFFDIDQDQGLWKQDELYFMDKIKFIEKYFTHKPLVLFQEDLKINPFKFFDDIANFVGGTYTRDEITLNKVHQARTDKQLKMMRKIGIHLFKKTQEVSDNYIINRVQSRLRQLKRMSILYAAYLFPDSYFDDIELLPSQQMNKIEQHYAEDFSLCQGYALENNPHYLRADS